jgi:hypothetical protein
LLFAPLVAAQDQAAVPASTLLTKLSAHDVTLDEARGIAAQLHDRTMAVRTSLFDALVKAYADQRTQCDRQRERALQRFTKAVPATQQALLGRGGETKVDASRKAARSISARAELSKEMIHAELDPLLAELRGLLLPTTAQVFTQEPALATEVEALRQKAAALDGWHDLCLEAAHHLDGDPEGRRHVERAGLPAPPSAGGGLDDECARACLYCLPLSAADRRALETNETLRAGTDPAEFAGTLELNRIRIALGLNAVRIDEKLGNAARDHSQDMHTLGFFAHESPVEGKRTFSDRASRAGTSASSENIAQGHSRGEGAIEAWWYSPGHHKNMLGGHARTGLGRYEQTWTQLFGG